MSHVTYEIEIVRSEIKDARLEGPSHHDLPWPEELLGIFFDSNFSFSKEITGRGIGCF